MEYYDLTVKLIFRVIDELRNNITEKGARFAQRYFLHKAIKGSYEKGMMFQPRRWNNFRGKFFSLFLLNTWHHSRREGLRSIQWYWSKRVQLKKSRGEWCSMKNQLDSGCKGRILQVLLYHGDYFKWQK